MRLSDTAIRANKPGLKSSRLSDGDGHYLLIKPSGGRGWEFDYTRPSGGRNTLSLGTYPEISLKVARGQRDVFRKQVAEGIDPGAMRHAEKEAKADSFEAVAREWHGKFSLNGAPSHSEKIIRRFERDLFPWIGKLPIAEIGPPELLRTLRRIESRGRLETAHRAHQNCGHVFRYAVATGRVRRDPSADLRGALAPLKPQRDPQAITARLLLGFYGAPYALFFGLARCDSDETRGAHACIAAGRVRVTGGAACRRYAAVAYFVGPLSTDGTTG